MAGNVPTFGLSWMLTWYSHILEEFSMVQRLFDACLASHPLFPLYLVAATIIYNKDNLLENFEEDDPLTSLFMTFQKLNPED